MKNYKVYSDKLNKVYNTVEDLEAAEAEFDEAHKAELKKAEERKTRAKEVEDAYKASVEVRKQAEKQINEADKKYFELRSKFIKDYGSFHMTYRDEDTSTASLTSIFDLLDVFFK